MYIYIFTVTFVSIFAILQFYIYLITFSITTFKWFILVDYFILYMFLNIIFIVPCPSMHRKSACLSLVVTVLSNIQPPMDTGLFIVFIFSYFCKGHKILKPFLHFHASKDIFRIQCFYAFFTKPAFMSLRAEHVFLLSFTKYLDLY